MGSGAIPTSVLSEQLERAIGQRRVKSAVFTAYTFDPGFFESEILPLLFNFSFSHFPKLRLIQLENELRSIDHLAVYYDRRGLETSGGSASLDYRRIPLERKGFFHPKLVMILVENHDEKTGERWDGLVLAVLSANLTRSGWWENVECADIREIEAGEVCKYRGDLLDFFSWIRREDKTGTSHDALEQIRWFIAYRTRELRQRTSRGFLHPRLFIGQESFSDFVAKQLKLPWETYNLEVISPFFDNTQEAKTLADLIEALGPKETRVYLPRDDDGTATCSETFYDAVAALPEARWAELPRSLLMRSRSGDESQSPRFVHAKVYRFWSRTEGKEFLIVGSVNLTRAAHSRSRAGNLEAAMVFESPPGSFKKRFWLEAMDNEFTGEFEAVANAEEPDEFWAPPVSVTYDWSTSRASYFWEYKRPESFEMLSAGSSLGRIGSVKEGEWTPFPRSVPQRLSEALKGTSFLEIKVPDGHVGTILVREQGMASKPSLLLSLTPEEILQYWSLLSVEQREVFLEKKAQELLIKEGFLPEKLTHVEEAPDSMFDRFAGIFHAFSSVEVRIDEALDTGSEREAVYRLFGQKYDSLPNLLDKVLEDKDGDLVNRWVTLLTAQQMLDRLTQRHGEFFAEHKKSLRALRRRLKNADKLKAQFSFDRPDAQANFLAWFERAFLAHAQEADSR